MPSHLHDSKNCTVGRNHLEKKQIRIEPGWLYLLKQGLGLVCYWPTRWAWGPARLPPPDCYQRTSTTACLGTPTQPKIPCKRQIAFNLRALHTDSHCLFLRWKQIQCFRFCFNTILAFFANFASSKSWFECPIPKKTLLDLSEAENLRHVSLSALSKFSEQF